MIHPHDTLTPQSLRVNVLDAPPDDTELGSINFMVEVTDSGGTHTIFGSATQPEPGCFSVGIDPCCGVFSATWYRAIERALAAECEQATVTPCYDTTHFDEE